MNTISFQVTKTKEIEPSIFTYGIVIESRDINKTRRSIDKILKNSTHIEKESLPNSSHIIPEKNDDIFSILIFKITGREELENFVSSLKPIEAIRGGIINTAIQDEEKEEFQLIQELTTLAKKKAEKYAKLCGQKVAGIISFKVSNKLGGWKAFPPIRNLTKETIYSAIVMKYDKHDKFEIDRTLEVEFEMK